jgi:6-phosphogluconate dehydrogenase
MQLGMIGLGKMGGNMVLRLLRAGHQCVVHDLDAAKIDALVAQGAEPARALADFVSKLERPRAVWVMLPAGAITEKALLDLAEVLSPGDVVIDGGNSWFKDDVRHAAQLAKKNVAFIDVGTSGGVFGIDRGYCLMIGGEKQHVGRLEPIFRSLAPGEGDIAPVMASRKGSAVQGFLHCGPTGSGHFVKMVHNGIEYGLMQAYAEGLDILRGANSTALAPEIRYELALDDISELWRRGSVIGSWLLDLTATALAEHPDLSPYEGHVADSGEGRWTVLAAIEEAVPADVLTTALYRRFRSRGQGTFADKVLSAMRFKFGGHTETANA